MNVPQLQHRAHGFPRKEGRVDGRELYYLRIGLAAARVMLQQGLALKQQPA